MSQALYQRIQNEFDENGFQFARKGISVNEICLGTFDQHESDTNTVPQ